MATTSRVMSGQTQEPRIPYPGLPHWCQRPMNFGHLHCLLRQPTSRKLDQKQSCWNMNRYSNIRCQHRKQLNPLLHKAVSHKLYIYLFPFLIYYLVARKNKRGKERETLGEGEKASILWFIPQMASTAQTDARQLSRIISRKLDQK